MPNSYDQLAKELNLTDVYTNASQLQALREWCGNNFLHDFSVIQTAKPEDEYTILQNIAREYLDGFLPQSQHLNSPNPNLMSLAPIEWAAYKGYIKFLIEHVNNVNPKNERTPLHVVAALGNLNAVEQLLDAGALNHPDKEKIYPIHLALCLTIAEQEEQVKEKNIDKRTAMYRLLQQDSSKSISKVTQQGQNVAHYMAIYGFDKLLMELLQGQSNLITAKNFQGYTPAHLAILNGQLSCLNTLLKNERLRNLFDSRGTLLHFAAEHGTKGEVAACLKAGVPYNQDRDGNTPAMRAILKDNVNALSGFTRVELEKERIGDNAESLLHFAVQHNKPFCKEWLSDPKNTNLNEVEDKNGLLPKDSKPENRHFTMGRMF